MHFGHRDYCGCHGHHDPGWGSGHRGGDCCFHGHSQRRFYTKEEIITHLEEYLKLLQAEAKGVEEHIDQLKMSE